MGRRSRRSRPKTPLASVVVIPDDSAEELFDSYANKATRTIEPDGIEKLCSDLGIAHTDVRILMLAWKMSAARMGYFTRTEWRNGLGALRADSMRDLSRALTDLEKKVSIASKEEFLEFYEYAFNYCLTEDMQRTLETESVCELLDMVLGSQFPAQVGKLVEYLKLQTDYKAIDKDQWSGFYRFCGEISFPDMADYEEKSCYYPSLVDSFVDWMKEEGN